MHFILTIVLTAALMLGITAPISQAMDLPQEVKNIVKRGQLRVGVKTDVPGFSVQDLSGNFQGMEVDIAKKLAMRMGLKANNIIYVPVTAKTRGQLVDSGDIDMVIATFTITEERKKTWNFSTPYYIDAISLLVKKSSNIDSYNDLKDKKVGVAEGSTSKEGLIKAAEQHGVTLSDTNNFQTFPDYPSIKAALDAGQVQAFCVDGSILAGYLDSGTHLLTSIRFMPQQYGIVTKLANKEQAAFVNECIETWLADGTIKEFIEDNNVPPSFNE